MVRGLLADAPPDAVPAVPRVYRPHEKAIEKAASIHVSMRRGRGFVLAGPPLDCWEDSAHLGARSVHNNRKARPAAGEGGCAVNCRWF